MYYASEKVGRQGYRLGLLFGNNLDKFPFANFEDVSGIDHQFMNTSLDYLTV
jgi:hypothetical protein